MDKRKRAKNTQSYDEINRQVKRACKVAKRELAGRAMSRNIQLGETTSNKANAWKDPEGNES